MKTCDKCGVEIHDVAAQGAYYEPGMRDHTPERCRDRLAARLAEAEMQNDIRRKEHIATCKTVDALRAELAECRAELEAAKREIQVGENLLSRRQVAAEARAERLWKALEEGRLACEPFDDVKPRKWVTDYENLARFHQHACGALAETEKEKP